MDLTSAIELLACFTLTWGALVIGTLVWRHFVSTTESEVSMGHGPTVETLHATLAVEAAAVVRARQRRH
jgi:hypothetical protein